MNYVSSKVANDDFTRALDDGVKKVKQDRRKKVDFMTWQQYIIEERYDAREEGREEALEECREEIEEAKAETEAAKAETEAAKAEMMKLRQELDQLKRQLKCD